MTPEIILAVGTAVASAVGAVFGGKNSLNGFKARVDENFKHLNGRFDRVERKVDDLAVKDAVVEVRVRRLEEALADEEPETEEVEA